MGDNTSGTVSLDPWRRRQAAMLYHYSSLNYLQSLQKLVTDFIDRTVDPVLSEAQLQGRDDVFLSSRWGTRETPRNWVNNAWPILRKLQVSIAGNIALRSFEQYNSTDVDFTIRAIDEFSMQWATEAEEIIFNDALAAIGRRAAPIDYTLQTHQADWDDFELTIAFQEYKSEIKSIPEFAVNMNIRIKSGSLPSRSGVYVNLADPDMALQFVWGGPHPCPLRLGSTFNALGLSAKDQVGREHLWLRRDRMLEFATLPKYIAEFKDEILIDGEFDRDLAVGAVARKAFEERTGHWHLVEIVSNDFESSEIDWRSCLSCPFPFA